MTEDMIIPLNNPKIFGDPWFHKTHSIVPPIFPPHPCIYKKENEEFYELYDKVNDYATDISNSARLYNILDPRRESDHIIYDGLNIDNSKRDLEEEYFKFSKEVIETTSLTENELKKQKDLADFIRIKPLLKNELFYPKYI